MRRSILITAAVLALIGIVPISLSMLSRRAAAQSSEVYVNVVDLDIKPGEMAKFVEFAKENGADAVKEPGCREHNIVVSKTDPNHILLFEVYDNEAALNAQRASGHFKQYLAATNDMIAARNVRGMSVVALNSKGH